MFCEDGECWILEMEVLLPTLALMSKYMFWSTTQERLEGCGVLLLSAVTISKRSNSVAYTCVCCHLRLHSMAHLVSSDLSLTKTNQNPHNYLLLTVPLLIFDPADRGKQVVQTLIKEVEQEKYSPGGQTLTFQEECQRQTAVARLFPLALALQRSKKLDCSAILKKNSLECKRNFLFFRKYHNDVFNFDMLLCMLKISKLPCNWNMEFFTIAGHKT